MFERNGISRRKNCHCKLALRVSITRGLEAVPGPLDLVPYYLVYVVLCLKVLYSVLQESFDYFFLLTTNILNQEYLTSGASIDEIEIVKLKGDVSNRGSRVDDYF